MPTIILHVVDSVNPQMDAQMEAVYETLRIGWVSQASQSSPCLTSGIWRRTASFRRIRMRCAPLPISARTGQGLDELKELLGELLRENKVYVERILSYANAGLVNLDPGKRGTSVGSI